MVPQLTIREAKATDYADETTRIAVERRLFRGARLLDDRRFMEWLNETAADLRYRVPRRMSLSGSFSRPMVYTDAELSSEDDLDLMDDDRTMMMARFMRLSTGMAWAENPATRTRRVLGNIEVFESDQPDQLLVLSNFVLHAARWDVDEHIYAGQRRDLFTRTANSFALNERQVILNTNVLNAPKLSVLF